MTEKASLSGRAALRKHVLRYFLVGGIVVLLDAVIYYCVAETETLNAAWAKRASFAPGAILGFFAKKFFTFARREFTDHEPVLFTLDYLAGWFLNSLLHDFIFGMAGMKSLAFLIVTAVFTCANFVGLKWLVFGLQRDPA